MKTFERQSKLLLNHYQGQTTEKCNMKKEHFYRIRVEHKLTARDVTVSE